MGGGHLTALVDGDGSLLIRHQTETQSYLIETDPETIKAGEDYRLVYSFGAASGMELYLAEEGLDLELLKANIDPVLLGDPIGLLGNQEPWTVGASQIVSLDGTASRLLSFLDGTIDEFEFSEGKFALDPQDEPLSLVGTNGPDDLVGAGADDVIDGRRGNDTLSGAAGDDEILGGSGDDEIDGGLGDDILFGGRGFDLLIGGDGNDHLFGDQRRDVLIGGAGNDILSGGRDVDTFIFQDDFGNDTITDLGRRDRIEIVSASELQVTSMSTAEGIVLLVEGSGTFGAVLLEGVSSFDVEDINFA